MSNKILVENMPSGKGYYGDKRVYIKKYTYGQLLAIAQSSNDELSITEISAKGIEADFDIMDLYNGLSYNDFEFILLYRRLTVPEFEKFSVSYRCKKCGTENSFISKVTDIKFKDNKLFEDGYGLPLSIPYNENNDCLDFVPYTLGMYIELIKKNMQNDLVAIMSIMVSNLPFEEAYDILSNITDESIIYSMKEMNDILNWGMEPIEKTCKNTKCKHKNTVHLDGNGVLLSPKNTSANIVGHRILFGNRKTVLS